MGIVVECNAGREVERIIAERKNVDHRSDVLKGNVSGGVNAVGAGVGGVVEELRPSAEI